MVVDNLWITLKTRLEPCKYGDFLVNKYSWKTFKPRLRVVDNLEKLAKRPTRPGANRPIAYDKLLGANHLDGGLGHDLTG